MGPFLSFTLGARVLTFKWKAMRALVNAGHAEISIGLVCPDFLALGQRWNCFHDPEDQGLSDASNENPPWVKLGLDACRSPTSAHPISSRSPCQRHTSASDHSRRFRGAFNMSGQRASSDMLVCSSKCLLADAMSTLSRLQLLDPNQNLIQHLVWLKGPQGKKLRC